MPSFSTPRFKRLSMNRIPITIVLLATAFHLTANTDESQLDERLNPEFESVAVDYGSYPSVRLNKNKIGLNGDDWSSLGEKYRAALAGDSLFTVVYLGDSHVQADFGGSVLRSRLSASHSAGRGLIIPFRLAGTNQPNDYSFGMTSAFLASKLMRLPWSTDMPFTGIGIKPTDHTFTLNIKSPTPVNTLRFHTTSGKLTTPDTDSFIDGDSLLCVSLHEAHTDFHINLKGDGDTVVGGVELIGDSTGVLVHSIGNNGATYSDYSLPPHFGSELARLHPDLIIIALGTNEAFGRITENTLRNNIDNLMNTIRRHNPDAKLLIVGPAECYRRTYRRTRRGRRRSAGQTVNHNVATIARSIRLYAEDEGIPYYNHFAVAGNAPSQRKAKLLGRDGVHYTVNGYQLWGNLLADAILDAMKP